MMSTLPGLIMTSVVVVVLLVVAYIVITFNQLVSRRNACANARAGIDVNLKRRHQLIPNLAAAVQGYASHERNTIVAVTQSRAQAVADLGKPNSAAAEAALEESVQHLAVRVEAYPDLKADGTFINLMKNLTEAEEQISASRRAFNAQVMRMNNLVQQFPSLFVAQFAGFEQMLPYSAEAAVQTAPAVVLSGDQNGG